jgi:hypothetical protein
LGASRDEILEAAAVALALNGAAADWSVRFVFQVLDDIEKESAD